MNILHKIKIHPLFYFVLGVCAFTGNFRKMIIFSIIILIHEFGHFITGYLLKWKVVKIDLYPYGGCTIFNNDINTSLKKELIVTIMGPIFQIVIIYLLSFIVDIDNFKIFMEYSKLILFFNLLPIYPLDGGKLLNVFFNFFLSYRDSFRITIFLSYFLFVLFLFIILFFQFNLLFILVLFLLGISIIKENKKGYIYFNKLLLERYINDYDFKKRKKITSIYKLKKDYYHYINGIDEKKYLKKFFNNI